MDPTKEYTQAEIEGFDASRGIIIRFTSNDGHGLAFSRETADDLAADLNALSRIPEASKAALQSFADDHGIPIRDVALATTIAAFAGVTPDHPLILMAGLGPHRDIRKDANGWYVVDVERCHNHTPGAIMRLGGSVTPPIQLLIRQAYNPLPLTIQFEILARLCDRGIDPAEIGIPMLKAGMAC